METNAIQKLSMNYRCAELQIAYGLVQYRSTVDDFDLALHFNRCPFSNRAINSEISTSRTLLAAFSYL